MSSSRKSSASSTRSTSSATIKPKVPYHLPKLPDKKLSDEAKKKTYVNDVTEKDIQDDKAMQRYKMMMQQLNEISSMNNKAKEREGKKITNGKLSPLIPSNSKTKSSNISKAINSTPSTTCLIKKNRLSPLRASSTDSDDDSGSDEDFRKNLKAPNELLEEFLIYVMEKKWTDAQKLCKFILMYEPNNKTAKEFMPLIESKINEFDEEEDEDDESSDETEEDDNDDDSDEDEDSDDDSDEDEDDEDENEEEIDSGNDQKLEKDLEKKLRLNNIDYDDDADILTPSVLTARKN
ncbi:unnamed protein product [Brachionus calyciflorus]|uniref:Uncharacterized protein n=1 Tax=Brachionus calyciflorus TaxID=104777 RepID=A0A813ZQ63_9BILA|nr:unnamed protein product [Brachionus calyciflorus]